jgi:hypothetical protein
VRPEVGDRLVVGLRAVLLAGVDVADVDDRAHVAIGVDGADEGRRGVELG